MRKLRILLLYIIYGALKTHPAHTQHIVRKPEMTRSLLLIVCWAIYVTRLTHSVSLSPLIEELKLIELTLRSQEAALTFTRGKAEKRPYKNCPTGFGICTKCVTMARFSRDFCSSCDNASEGGAVQSSVGARIRSVDRSQTRPRIGNGIIRISHAHVHISKAHSIPAWSSLFQWKLLITDSINAEGEPLISLA
jgi:hypothetical protein